MEHARFWKAVRAGFAATVGMSIVLYAAFLAGMTNFDIAASMGSLMSSIVPQPGSAAWIWGLVIHFFVGSIVFPLIYSYALYPVMQGPNLIRGVMWATFLWFLMQIIELPILGRGVFAADSPHQPELIVTTLIAHWVYGAILGILAGRQALLETDLGAEPERSDFEEARHPIH